MRHSVYGRHLGRDKNQRTALFRGLIRSLVLHESIETTQTKAKAVKGLIDKVIVRSKDNSQASLRVVESIIPQKEVLKKLREEIAPRFTKRTSGYTQIVRLGKRLGDGSMMVRMSIIGPDQEVKPAKKETIKPEAESAGLETAGLESEEKEAKETNREQGTGDSKQEAVSSGTEQAQVKEEKKDVKKAAKKKEDK